MKIVTLAGLVGVLLAACSSSKVPSGAKLAIGMPVDEAKAALGAYDWTLDEAEGAQPDSGKFDDSYAFTKLQPSPPIEVVQKGQTIAILPAGRLQVRYGGGALSQVLVDGPELAAVYEMAAALATNQWTRAEDRPGHEALRTDRGSPCSPSQDLRMMAYETTFNHASGLWLNVMAFCRPGRDVELLVSVEPSRMSYGRGPEAFR